MALKFMPLHRASVRKTMNSALRYMRKHLNPSEMETFNRTPIITEKGGYFVEVAPFCSLLTAQFNG